MLTEILTVIRMRARHVSTALFVASAGQVGGGHPQKSPREEHFAKISLHLKPNRRVLVKVSEEGEVLSISLKHHNVDFVIKDFCLI